MGLKLLSLYVKGLNSPFNRSMLWRDVLKSQAKIICLQETHLLASDTYRLKHKKCPQSFHSTHTEKRAGVSIFIKDSTAFQLLSSHVDPKSRYVILTCILNSRIYMLVSLYAPNTQQKTFMKKIIAEAKEFKKGGLIVCGDFNIVMDKQLIRSTGS